LIGLQARGRTRYFGAGRRVIATEVLVEIGDAAIAAHQFLDAGLRPGAVEALCGCGMGGAQECRHDEHALQHG